jgi:hypothetical protein
MVVPAGPPWGARSEVVPKERRWAASEQIQRQVIRTRPCADVSFRQLSGLFGSARSNGALTV